MTITQKRCNYSLWLLLLGAMAIVGCSRKVAPKESVIRVNTQQVVTASNGVTKNYVGTSAKRLSTNWSARTGTGTLTR